MPDKRRSRSSLLAAVLLIVLFGCDAEFLSDQASILGNEISRSVFTWYAIDDLNDPDDAAPESTPDGPQYFSEVDFARVSCAVKDDRFCIYIEVVGVLGDNAIDSGYSSEQIRIRTINVGVDIDNSRDTGFSSWGMDLHATYRADPESGVTAYYGVYEHNEDDTHVIDRFDGQIHGGGIGSNYVIISAPLSAVAYLNTDVVEGATVTIRGWAEAESTSYHHFAVDTLMEGQSPEIEVVLGGG